jgi:hypothetical protein
MAGKSSSASPMDMAASFGSFLLSTDVAAAAAVMGRAKKQLQDATNERAGKEAAHQTVMQSLGNQRRVDAAGKRYAVLQENLSRSVDSMTAQTAMGMLRTSEQLGAVVAQAAAAGMGGSSVEAYNQTIRTMAAQRVAMSARDKASSVRNQQDNSAELMADAYGGMDRTFVAANIDRSYVGSTAYDFWGDLATTAVAVGISAAGAPQVGMAIMDAKASGNYADAGQAQAANQSLSSSLGHLNKSGNDWNTLSSYFKLPTNLSM